MSLYEREMDDLERSGENREVFQTILETTFVENNKRILIVKEAPDMDLILMRPSVDLIKWLFIAGCFSSSWNFLSNHKVSLIYFC